MVGLAAFVASLLFQTVQLVREQATLAGAYAEQARPVLEGDRVRRQIEALLAGTNELSRQGNAAATGVLEAIAKQGVTYTPPAQPGRP